jgi:hypothetical protein
VKVAGKRHKMRKEKVKTIYNADNEVISEDDDNIYI